MKRLLKCIIALATIITAFPSMTDVYATDYEENESYYYKLCSSSSLTSTEITTCREFSNYLTVKSANASEVVSDAKTAVTAANGSLQAIQDEIESINNQMEETQEQIDFLLANIENLELSIAEKDGIIRERMYAMQSSINSNMFVQFIFGASSFGDLLSRTDSIKELTAYDKELIEGLTTDKEIIEQQKELVVETMEKLENQKTVQVALETEAQAIYDRELAALESAQSVSSTLTENQQIVSSAIAQSFANLNATSGSTAGLTPGSSALGNTIASMALSKVGSRYWWGAPGGGYGDPANLYSLDANYFDCSGLVAWAHYHSGKSVSRLTASAYSKMGTAVSYSNLQAGDVVTVSGGGSYVYHIGIYIGGGYVVHASGYGSETRGQYASQCVRVDSISVFQNMGIYNYRRLY